METIETNTNLLQPMTFDSGVELREIDQRKRNRHERYN